MRVAFKVPLQSEVETYMKEKTGWPDSFCKYYAAKFWNHYQASGWKLSSGNSMKDWKACFNAQWQTPKFKEDIEMLHGKKDNTVHASPKPAAIPTNDVERLDALLKRYASRPSIIEFEEFGTHYDYMKANDLLKKLTKEEVDGLLTMYKGDKMKCRCACVQMTMDGYVIGGITFGEIMGYRTRLNAAAHG